MHRMGWQPGTEGVRVATYPVRSAPHNGAELLLSAPGGVSGDLAPTGEGVELVVNNGSGATVTVTLPFNPKYDDQTVTSRDIPVPAGAIWRIPLPSSVYGNQPTPVNYSAVASVTVGVVRRS